MYRLMAAGVLQQGLDFCVVGYNTYAGEDTVAGHVDHQVCDVAVWTGLWVWPLGSMSLVDRGLTP